MRRDVYMIDLDENELSDEEIMVLAYCTEDLYQEELEDLLHDADFYKYGGFDDDCY